MLFMRQCSFLSFLTLTKLTSSISNNCTYHFEFPNLNDSQRIISHSNENVSVEFRVNSTCSTPFTGAFIVLDKTKPFCTFHHQNGNCGDYTTTNYCRCPKEGSDLYRVEIPADKGHSGTWTWSSTPFRVKEHQIHIVVIGKEEPTTPESRETTQQALMTTDSTRVSRTSVGPDDHIKDEPSGTEFFFSVPGIIMMTVNAVIVVSFISLVVFVIRRKVTLRKRLAQQHDLVLHEIQDRNQHPPLPPPAQSQQQQQQRRLPEIPGQYQVPSSVPASSELDARRSLDLGSHMYEVVGGDQEGEVPDVLKTELPDTNLHPRPPAQVMTAAQASKPGIGNGLYFHIDPTK